MRTVVVVPTYNEAEKPPRLATLPLPLEPGIDVVCVDDNSADSTQGIVEHRGPLRRAVSRSGSGYARIMMTYVDRCRESSKVSNSIIFEALVRSTVVGLARLAGRRRWPGLWAAQW